MITSKEKYRAGTKVVDLSSVGRQIKDRLSKLRFGVPALNFSFKNYLREFIGALWLGHTLPFRFRFNGEVVKETFYARLSFATLFIVSDSIYLVGKSGIWLIKKLAKAKGLSGWNVLLTAGSIVGFLGWVFPWWLEFSGFWNEIADTHTMQAIGQVQVITPVPEVDIKTPSLGWLAIPMVGALPFSWLRFRRFSGVKTVLRKKTKPIVGDDQHAREV